MSTQDTLLGGAHLVLPEFDDPPADPVDLVRRWLAEATKHGVREARAVTLSTASADGTPSSRVVLLKEVDAGSAFVFTSHTGSRKGRELAANPKAAMTFHWRETLQQITVAGTASRAPDAVSDRLFAERPPDARATTIASEQSAVLLDERALHEDAARLVADGHDLPRPEGWAAFRLVPRRIEFWHGHVSRLHRRLSYTADGDGWTARRLQP